MSDSVHSLYLPCTYFFAEMLHERRDITKDYKTLKTPPTTVIIDLTRYPKSVEERRIITEKSGEIHLKEA